VSNNFVENNAFIWEPPATFNFAEDVVDHWAKDPKRLALICVDDEGAEKHWTYDAISKASARLANLLVDQGLKRGDHIIVMLPRIAEWQIAMTAVLRLGAVPVPCITMLTEKDVDFRVEQSGATGAITRSDDTSKFAGSPHLKVRVCVGDETDGWVSFKDCDQASAGNDDLISDLQNYVKTATALYKYPRKIEFTTDLPKTPTGKIKRIVLRGR